ncbi:MAG: S8 family serine peptidase, partial [Chthoniobacterales bacterium]
IAQEGLAPGTDLRSAAVATSWSGNAYALSFGISANSYITAYGNSFAVADVVNSSYSYSDAGGTDVFTIFSDAMSFQNPETLQVVSAGNSGPGANTVGAPGSGYNTLTVGALGSANNFNTVASFSSRGPQDFAYIDYAAGGVEVTVAGVRAAVDIAAPGESLVSAFYGGQTGGNNTSLAGSSNQGTNADAYSAGIAGTSFASPIVAGGAALAYSAAKTLPSLSTNAEATQNMVVKSLLLTGADKTSGWSNGQFTTNGVVTTTQSLDWAVGAGRMNLDRTFDLQVNGQTGVDGIAVGAQGAVLGTGWDFGAAQLGFDNDYTIDDVLLGGSTFTTSLSWMRDREYVGGYVDDYAQADLNISLWSLGSDYSFQSKVAESISLYNTVEH